MSELRAFLVTPLSGPLTQFGHATARGLRLWAEEAAALPPRWQRVQLDVHNDYPDLAAAMGRGLAAKPHLIFGPYGSDPALRAIRATERTVWNHGGATSSIRWPVLPRAVNVLAPASSYFQGTLEARRRVDPDAQRSFTPPQVSVRTSPGCRGDCGPVRLRDSGDRLSCWWSRSSGRPT